MYPVPEGMMFTVVFQVVYHGVEQGPADGTVPGEM